MNPSRRAWLLICAVFVVLGGAQGAMAQCVSLTTLATASTQNFDTLSNTAGSTTNSLTITGWFLTETGGGARDNEQYAVDTGASGTGDTYSYGSTAATDRALGSLRSGTLIPVFGGCFTNNTGATIASLNIGYTGEEWRLGTAARTDQLNFEFSLNATDLVTGTWTGVAALNFVTPVTVTAGAKDGNAAANRTVIAPVSIPALSIANGASFFVRWIDTDATGADDGLAVDNFSLTPQGGAANAAVVPTCPATLTTTVGTATSGGASATDSDGTVTSATITGITPVNPGTITLTGFTAAGGVGGTATATLSVSNTTPANTYSVTIQWANNDGTPQTANCVVSVVVNPAPVPVFIHDVQGSGAATPIPGSTVTVQGVVVGSYQGASKLQGFFLQEEDADADANPATSEGIFIFCGGCATAVAEGQIVQVTGSVSEFNSMTQITSSTVTVTNAGNNLALATPATIDLPIAGVVDDFYEAREGMRVNFIDPLTVSEYFELFRYGQMELFEGGRPLQYTETNAPSVAGYTAHLAALDRRRVILDDDNNAQNVPLTLTDGLQFVYHPRANGGLSVGTQGTDFVRGGDQITSLTGVLHWSFPGFGANTWRIRPTAATPATFTVANPRPATPPAVGGAIKAAGLNLLNYFTTIDTTASSSSGPCAPSGTQDCRGADSVAELNRQRERASIVLCTINADVFALMELENTTPSATITDLLGAVNARCGGANPYAFVNTGGTLGTDAIRVQEIYRTGIVSPVGSPLVDLDPIHNRPPTAQTFDVVAATNPAFGQRFTVIANHFKSKGCGGAAGADADAGDGQGCFAATRTAQSSRLLTWINSTVIPAAGDPDVLLLGDFNSYAQETPVTTLTGAGFVDVSTALLGSSAAYSYLFDAQLGHLDYAFASTSLMTQVTGVGPWHINADEADLFDYNDEVRDTGEAAFEEKPDGSALVPPRVVFQPASPYRAADHDPVTLALFQVADIVVTKTDSPDPVTAGANLTYTVTVTNNGPDAAATASWSDTLPAGTTFVSLTAAAGWSCTTPAVGAAGTVSCSNPSFAVGSAIFTLTVAVAPTVASGTVLSNTATGTSASAEGNPGNESGTATTTVATSADLSVTKVDTPDPVSAGSNLTYTITATNAGPSNAATVSLSDTLPAGTTFVSLSSPGGWSCTTPAVGAGGTVTCSIPSLNVGSSIFTLIVAVDPATASGTVLSNTAIASSATSDPNPGNESGTATTTVAASADLSVTKIDTPDPVTAGTNLTYTITVTNAGPSNASTVNLADTLPAGTTFISLSSPGGWSCTTPAVGAGGTITCSTASLGIGNAAFTLTVAVAPALAGSLISNTATASSTTTDPNPGNESGSATTSVNGVADLSVTKVDTPDPVNAGSNLTYTITVANAGPSNASTVNLSDTLPAGTTFVSLSSPGGWSCTTPAVGAGGAVTCSNSSMTPGNAVFTLTVAIPPSTAAGTVITNTANVTAETLDSNPGNQSGTSTTTVAAAADISVTKVDTPDPVTAGSNLTYTITLTNAGPSNAATVTLTDTVPAGTTFMSLSSPGGWSCTAPAVGGTGAINCSIASLGVGNAVFTLVVAVDPALASGTIITNTATGASTTTDPNAGNETGTATTTVGVGSADLSVTKVDTPDPVAPGSNLTYTITVNNAGPSSATTANLSDTLPPGTTFVSLAPAGGWSCTTPAVGASGTVSCTNGSMTLGSAVFTLTVAVAPSVAPGTILTNTATVTSATSDLNPGNGSSTATTTVSAGSADLSVAKVDTPDPVMAASNLTYTITVTNAGPSNAVNAALSDTLPAGTTFVSLASAGGWSCTTPAVGAAGTVSCTNASMPIGSSAFTLIVAVSPSATAGTVITNTATASSTTTDPNPANQSGTATTTVAAGSADLSITKIDTPDPVTAGSSITYTITVNNAGPSDATSASLTDTLPAGTTFVSLASPAGWVCVTPAPGAAGTVTCTNPSFVVGSAVFTLNVNVSGAAGSLVTNTATVTSASADPTPANGTATATTTVLAPANVSGTKTAAGTFTPGSALTYTIVLTNSGSGTQGDNPGNEFIDVLPSQLTLVSATATTGTAVATTGTNTVTWNGSIPAAGSVTITIQATISPATPIGTTITNQGTINYDADGNGTNESSATTDDPSLVGNQGTGFAVLAPALNGAADIPALDGFGLAALAALMAALGLLVVRRS